MYVFTLQYNHNSFITIGGMKTSKILQDILETVNSLKPKIITIDEDLTSLKETVNFIKDNAASKEDLKDFAKKEDLSGFVTKDHLELVLSGKNYATRDDLNKYATRDDLIVFKNELIGHIDGFVGKHKKFESELTSHKSKSDRIETKVKGLYNHLDLDYGSPA